MPSAHHILSPVTKTESSCTFGSLVHRPPMFTALLPPCEHIEKVKWVSQGMRLLEVHFRYSMGSNVGVREGIVNVLWIF